MVLFGAKSEEELLLVAAQRGDVAAARLALDRGADPECADTQVRRRKRGRIGVRGAATLAIAQRRRRCRRAALPN
jgi:hypothetical protein